jgi:hypothetical protein
MEKENVPVDKALCAICGAPAKPGEPIMAHAEKDSFVHGRCYDAEFEPKKKQQ